MKKLFMVSTFLFSINHALASELTDVAGCAGMIIGDAAITYDLDGNVDNFEVALEVAYAGYFGYVFGSKPAQQDVLQADTVMQKNIELIFNKYENGTYTNDTFQEVIECYQVNSIQLIVHGEAIRDNAQIIRKFAGDAKNNMMALLQ
jgi:hypothetical protein